jgi:hypothetical protein
MRAGRCTRNPFGRIAESEVYEALLDGEVIEDYPDDTPLSPFGK